MTALKPLSIALAILFCSATLATEASAQWGQKPRNRPQRSAPAPPAATQGDDKDEAEETPEEELTSCPKSLSPSATPAR